MYGNSLENPDRRQCIRPFTLGTIAAMRHGSDRQAAALLSAHGVHVLPIDSTLSLRRMPPAVLQNLRDQNLLSHGAILLQNPYNPDMYADALTAAEQFGLEKQQIFSHVCGLLGATRYEIKEVRSTTESREHAGGVEVGVPKACVRLGVERDRSRQFLSKMSLNVEFSGGPANVEKARAYLHARRLQDDPTMRSLLVLRENEANTCRRKTFHLSMRDEINKRLKLLVGIVAPKFRVALDYSHVFHELTEHELTVEVTF